MTEDLTKQHLQDLHEISAKAKAEDEKWASEVDKRNREIVEIRTELQKVQRHLSESFTRFDRIAVSVAASEAQRVARIEIALTVILAILSVAVFCAPLIWKTGRIYDVAAWITALLSAGGFFALLLNRQFKYFDGILQAITERRVSAVLQQQGLEEYASRVQIDYRLRSVILRNH